MANSTGILNWYCEKLENPSDLFNYLAGNSTLHWFGRTIDGRKEILYFIKMRMVHIKHILRSSQENNFNGAPKSLGGVTPKVYFEPEGGSNGNVFCTPEKLVSSVFLSTNAKESTKLSKDKTTNKIKEIEPNMSPDKLKYTEMRGILQLQKQSNKRIYERPCKITIGYTGDLYDASSFCIKQIAYQDCISCRKNLLVEFDNCFDDEGFVSETN